MRVPLERLLGATRKPPGETQDTPDSTSPIPIVIKGLEEPAAEPTSIDDLVPVLKKAFDQALTPERLLQDPDFERGVRFLTQDAFSDQALYEYAAGYEPGLSCAALTALTRREPGPGLPRLLFSLINAHPWARFFVLRALDIVCPPTEKLIPTVLVHLDPTWYDDDHPVRFYRTMMRRFIEERLKKGDKPAFSEELLEKIPEYLVDSLDKMLADFGEGLTGTLLGQLRAFREIRVDVDFLASVGAVWKPDEAKNPFLIEHDSFLRDVQKLETALESEPPLSMLVVGESGVGKTAIIRLLAKRAMEKGWTVFEAGYNELLAGQSHIGSLEERLRDIVQRIGGRKKVLWVIPDFHALEWAGRHSKSDYGILDFLIPEMERGNVTAIGEVQPSPFEHLLLSKPQVVRAMDILRVQPLSQHITLELAKSWMARVAGSRSAASDEVIEEAWQLSEHYFKDRAAPGNLLRLLQLTWQRLSDKAEGGGAGGPAALRIEDLVQTLARLTGLPSSILDERLPLDLDGLRSFFLSRVIGQKEAVDCLVERVAMVKAGLTDPTRPQGVFLFAGPTGTGKTEIAKALAEYLFGSPDRLIRLDMSEFQSPESLQLLQGDAAGKTEGALVGQIRRQPFSVVLLDEFEKASPNVWDLFLQVFDDGRLTDRRGNTADFRHAIVIMTSNLGAVIPTGASLGFTPETGQFNPRDVERAIQRSFRKEFLNRIDRIVVFQPLARETMRNILLKELNTVLRRRGLRRRSWAVEWDDSAIEFLLEKGFTQDMGARPLKRAIEDHVLTRLATTIVDRAYPQGDQFLFVRSDGRSILVEFVDPDAPDKVTAESPPTAVRPAAGPSRLEEIALDPAGTPEEIALLRSTFERLAKEIEAEDWKGDKAKCLAMTSERGFWDAPNRFSVLGRIEVLDRIETGFTTAQSLLDRLDGSRPGRRNRFPVDLVRRLAERLFLLDRACSGLRNDHSQDAFLVVDPGADTAREDIAAEEFAHQLASMYQEWAARRGMKVEVLEKRSSGALRVSRLMIAISGFGAYPILATENGLHVLESPADKGKSHFERVKIRVRVVPQPDEPVGVVHKTALEQAQAAFGAQPPAEMVVVRRYRKEPSPLVRDSVRGWKTGRWDKVFAGNFDLFPAGRD
jgi:ATP-dependent Clp protease ATP-binding subunit ClpC